MMIKQYESLTNDQAAAFLLGCIYLILSPGYLQPEKAFLAFHKIPPRDNSDILDTLLNTSYLAFFGLHCLVAATNAHASRLTVITQLITTGFYLYANYAITPQLGVIPNDILTILRRVWGAGLAICLATLFLDWKKAMFLDWKKTSCAKLWKDYLSTTVTFAPAQIGVFLCGCIWLLFLPGYFQPELMFQDFHGIEPRNNIDVLSTMTLCTYCGFFGLRCIVAATDSKAARLEILSGLVMTLFYLRFHYVISPSLGVFLPDTLLMIHKLWGFYLILLLSIVCLDMMFLKINLAEYLRTIMLSKI